MKQLEFNFNYVFSSDLEKRLFWNWVKSMFSDCNSERRRYQEKPYKSVRAYYKRNKRFLIYEWETKIKSLSMQNAEIS